MGNMGIDSLKKFFCGKRILITGNTGFKGSWLVYFLTYLGADVYGYSLPPEKQEDLFNILHLERKIHQKYADVRDYSELKSFIDYIKPTIVFHLAAQSLVRRSYVNPKMTFDVNLRGSVNVLEGIRHSPEIRALIFVTSDKCYKNNEWIWGYRENDELGGNDPYSASKAAAEIVFHSYLESFFKNRQNIGVASVRAGNVIGGGDWSEDRLIPDTISAILQKQSLKLRYPDAIRPWQHVFEPLYGYLILAQQLFENPKEFEGSYNFGPGIGGIHTVRDVVESIITHWGTGAYELITREDNFAESGILSLNCDKAAIKLGWKPALSFSETVSLTVDWYKKTNENYDQAEKISTYQITKYMELHQND